MSTGQNPLSFSVIIPTYNSASTITLALQSIEQQSYPAHEVIVIDDGSYDQTGNAIRCFMRNSKLPIVLITQANKGAGSARNKGIDVASGDWLLFLDSDDIWKHHRIENLSNYILKYPDVDFVHTDRDYDSPNGAYQRGSNFPAEKMVKRTYLFSGFSMKTSTVSVKRSHIAKYNLRFSECVATCEDYYLFWTFLLETDRIGYINSADVIISDRDGSLTRDDNLFMLLFDNIRVLNMIIKSMGRRTDINELRNCLTRLRYRSVQSLLLKTGPIGKRIALLPFIFKSLNGFDFVRAVLSTLLVKDTEM